MQGQIDLTTLNPPQREAVLHGEGPLLILAGAGSGKTRVITYRIAHLIEERGLFPANILAITFTNKAAREMKERLEGLVGEKTNGIWIGTFHAMFLRILRAHCELLGFRPGLNVLGIDEQEQLMRETMKEMRISTSSYKPRDMRSYISAAKNALQSPEEMMNEARQSYQQDKQTAAEIFPIYQKNLKANNAVDFDDILNLTLELFQQYPQLLKSYQQRFRHILVDEYQDSNQAQYMLVHLLAGKSGNLCVVGDDDQSIYGFRGADIRNILNFEHDYPSAKVIKLEQNYRSSEPILSAANAVIAHNEGRKSKKLWTAKAGGEKIVIYAAEDQQSEARFVASEIQRLIRRGVPAKEIAILYRINVLSRNLEFALRDLEIPYHVFAGTAFYERAEIKQVLSYLRFIVDSSDQIALRRLVQLPRRGLGEVSLAKLEAVAQETDGDLLKAMFEAERAPELKGLKSKFLALAEMILSLRQALDGELSFSDWLHQLIYETGLAPHYKQEALKGGEEESSRLENIMELISDAQDFEQQFEAEWESVQGSLSELQSLPLESLTPLERSALELGPGASMTLRDVLLSFLDRASLYTNLDDSLEEKVTLLTTHAAKGAEYDVVFVVGLEETIFPSYRSMYDPENLEEERRICYVALTRARERLYLTAARYRLLYGQSKYNPPSRFLTEIPSSCRLELNSAGTLPDISSGGAVAPSRRSQEARQEVQKFKLQAQLKKKMQEARPQKRTVSRDGLAWTSLEAGRSYRHAELGEVKVEEILSLGNDAILTLRIHGQKRRFVASQCPLEELE